MIHKIEHISFHHWFSYWQRTNFGSFSCHDFLPPPGAIPPIPSWENPYLSLYHEKMKLWGSWLLAQWIHADAFQLSDLSSMGQEQAGGKCWVENQIGVVCWEEKSSYLPFNFSDARISWISMRISY